MLYGLQEVVDGDQEVEEFVGGAGVEVLEVVGVPQGVGRTPVREDVTRGAAGEGRVDVGGQVRLPEVEAQSRATDRQSW